MSNPNIYGGDKSKYRSMVVSVKLPEGLTDDEELEFMSGLFLAMSNGNPFMDYKKGSKSKSIHLKNVLTKGWDYA